MKSQKKSKMELENPNSQPQQHTTVEYDIVETTNTEYSFYYSDNYEMFKDHVEEIKFDRNGVTTICKVVYPKEFNQRYLDEQESLKELPENSESEPSI